MWKLSFAMVGIHRARHRRLHISIGHFASDGQAPGGRN
jgi:hypothetical protein